MTKRKRITKHELIKNKSNELKLSYKEARQKLMDPFRGSIINKRIAMSKELKQ